jgi:20S proteasome subunit alpha 2
LEIEIIIIIIQKAKNGVVLATEKKLPALIEPSTVQKISNYTHNIGVVYAGLGPDSRVLLRKGRKQAQQYYRTYIDPISVAQLVKEQAAVMQEFTQTGYENKHSLF